MQGETFSLDQKHKILTKIIWFSSFSVCYMFNSAIAPTQQEDFLEFFINFGVTIAFLKRFFFLNKCSTKFNMRLAVMLIYEQHCQTQP